MPYFTDNARRPRTWRVALAYGDVVRIRERLAPPGPPVDLLDPHAAPPGEPSLIARLESDDELLVNVLYVLLEPEADRRSVDDIAFGRGLRARGREGRDVLPHARRALFEAWAEFFPRPAEDDEADQGDDDEDTAGVDRDALVWELAGVVGVHPGKFSFRQLAEMSRGKSREAWGRTSSAMAQAASIATGKPVKPKDLNPFRRKPRGGKRGGRRGLPLRLFVEAMVEAEQKRKQRNQQTS